jgi:hypothetical protein
LFYIRRATLLLQSPANDGDQGYKKHHRPGLPQPAFVVYIYKIVRRGPAFRRSGLACLFKQRFPGADVRLGGGPPGRNGGLWRGVRTPRQAPRQEQQD